MKKKFLKLLFLSMLFGFGSYCMAESIMLPKVEDKPQLKLNSVEKKQTKKLILTKQEELSEIVKMQQESEIKDIELLWEATVDNNKLIKFAMQKLNTPEGQRRLHSSMAAKTLSAVVYGASFLPALVGSDSIVQSASFATGRLVNNFLNKNAMPKQDLLTDTELIELAGTIESLQETVISSYYNYKGALNKLQNIRSQIVLYNKNYSKALNNDDEIEVIISASQYDDMLLKEFYCEQEAKKYYLELEKLAGAKTISKLNLTQFAYKNTIINPEKFNQSNNQ